MNRNSNKYKTKRRAESQDVKTICKIISKKINSFLKHYEMHKNNTCNLNHTVTVSV